MDTIWVSGPGTAWELKEGADGRWAPTGRSAQLDQPGDNPKQNFGSGIAMDPSGTVLWGAPFWAWSPNFPIRLRWVNVVNGESGDLQLNIPNRDIGPNPNGAHLNSLSFSQDGAHIWMGAAQKPFVWKVDPSVSGPAQSPPRTMFGTSGGSGGDFIAIPGGGTLGADNNGNLLYWAGELDTRVKRIGTVKMDNGATIGKIQGLAKVGDDIYLVDGGAGGDNTSRGMHKLPDDFLDTLRTSVDSFTSATVHQTTLAFANSLSTQGLWDLTAAQDSFYCPPEPEGGTFRVEKRPLADQDPAVEGDQASPVIAPDGNVTSYYDIVVTNDSTVAAKPGAPVSDTFTLPAGISVVRATASIGGRTVATSESGTFEVAPDDIGEIPAGGSVTIRVRLDARADATAMGKVADGDEAYVCESPTPPNADAPRGLFNAVTMEGEEDPAQATNNQACVTPTVPPVQVEKLPRPGHPDQPSAPVKANPDGSAELKYTVVVTNPSANRTFSGPVEDTISLPEFVRPTGDATIAAPPVQGVTVENRVSTWPKDTVRPGAKLRLADNVTLVGGAAQTFVITIPVKVEATPEQWEELKECRPDGGGIAGGVHNLANMERDADGPENNLACIPLVKDDLPVLTIDKVDLDDVVTPLNGAEFALHGATADGGFDPGKVIVPGTPTGTFLARLEPGTYYLTETRAPDGGYQLLPRPIGIVVGATADRYTLELRNPDDAVIATPVVDDNGHGLHIRVADVRAGELPMTGPGDQAMWWALAGLLAAALAAHNIREFRRTEGTA